MILYMIGFFVLIAFLIIIFNRYKKESSVRYYDKLRWQFDKKDAETVDVVEVTKAENGIESEPEPEEEYEPSSVGGLYQFILSLVLFGVMLGVGMTVLDSFTAESGAMNVTSASMEALQITSTWLPLIVTVAVLGIIMSLVIGAFAGGRR